MKTTLPIFFLLLVLFKVQAQESLQEVPTIEHQVKVDVPAENRFLMRRLLLNESQFEKVAEINTERNQMLEMVVAMYRFDPENYRKKALELELQFDAEFEKVLTRSQFSEYLALKGRTNEPAPTLQPEENMLAGKTEESAPEKPAPPTFNDQIHAILEKATAIKIDSALIAKHDTIDFVPLTSAEQDMLNGLLPQNATLIAIQADTTKKAKTVAKTELKPDSINIDSTKIANVDLKPDGECKTCFSIEPTDVTNGNSRQVALKSTKKTSAVPGNDEWDNAEKNYNATPAETDPFLTETPQDSSEIEKPAAIAGTEEKQRITSPKNETPDELNKPIKNENALVIPANEVKKLRESLPQTTKNAKEKEEKTDSETIETPQLTEPLPLNKSLANDKDLQP